jgi:uncharacterized protein (TIGR02246 family)
MKTFVIGIMLLIGAVSYAQDSKESIKHVFDGLSDAWEQADGNAWGNYFTDAADFTVWFGLHLKGRKEISEGHQWVFDTLYPNTRYEFTITDLYFLKPDIAIAHLNASIIKPGDALPEEPHTLPVAVLQKIGNTWKIVMFHNMKNQIKEIEEGRKKGILGDVRH